MRNYGPIDNDFFWIKYPHLIEYQQALKVTIYCSFEFKTFPFDSHNCDFNFGSLGIDVERILLNSSRVRYKKTICMGWPRTSKTG